MSHGYGRSSVCVRSWINKLYDLEKCLAQNRQMYSLRLRLDGGFWDGFFSLATIELFFDIGLNALEPISDRLAVRLFKYFLR